MITGKATLVLDLGNSETRVRTYYGKTAKGQPRYRASTLPNVYASLRQDQEGSEEYKAILANELYNEDNSKILRMNDDLYFNGLMCEREMSRTLIRPTSSVKKYDAITSDLALRLALLRGIEDVADMVSSDVESVDVSWEVDVLLPPGDIDTKYTYEETGEEVSGAKAMANMIKGIRELEFIMPDIKKPINIETVKIFPEGFCALIAVLFSHKGIMRPEYAYLVEDDTRTIICDIGAGTTDFVIAEGSNVISSTRFTKEIGGNNVHIALIKKVRDEMGITISDAAARKACETGFVKSGARSIDIRDMLSAIKEDISVQLVNAVQQFFELNNAIPVQSIANMLICGGGSESGDIEGIEPISNFILKYMKKISKYINLVEMPEVEVAGEVSKMSPRYLNIIGAGILAE